MPYLISNLDIKSSNAALRNDTWNIFKEGSTYFAKKFDTSKALSNTDFKTLFQAVIDTIPVTDDTVFTKIKFSEGNFDFESTVQIIKKWNISIEGSGMGVTRFRAGATLTGGTAMWQIYGDISAAKNLTANATIKTNTVTVSTGDAATFAVGDWVLISSNALFVNPATVSSSAKKGELKKIVAVDTGTGVITFDEFLFDGYLTADTATIQKHTMTRNISISDLTICPHPSYSDSANPIWLSFKWAERIGVNNIELRDSVGNFAAGALSFRQTVGLRISNCHFQLNIPYNFQYGISLQGACQNVVVSNCTSYGDWRHPFEAAVGQTDLNGICRNCVFTNCVSTGGTQAQLDSHPDGEHIGFVNCGTLGTGDGAGIKLRSPKSYVIGCTARSCNPATGGGAERGAIKLSEAANDCIVSNNIIVDSDGDGITVEDGIDGILIKDNIIDNATLDGIRIQTGGSSKLIISGNRIKNCDSDGIEAINTDDSIIEGNIIDTNAAWGIKLDSSSTGNVIQNNIITGNTTGAIDAADQTGNLIDGNIGFHVQGRPSGVENPFSGIGAGPTLNRTGVFWGTTASVGDGILSSNITAIGTPAGTNSTTEGKGMQYSTGAVSGNNAGIRYTAQVWRREWGTYLKIRFIPSTTTNIRAFIGFSSDTAEIAGETSLDNFSGVALVKRAADTNWFIARNDGDATTDYVDTTIAFAAAATTIEIFLDSTSLRGSINGTAIAAQTTELPAAATSLALHAEVEASAAEDKNIQIFAIFTKSGVTG